MNLLHEEYNFYTCLTHKQVIRRLRNQANQAKDPDVLQPTAMAATPLLLRRIGVADGVHGAADAPHEAERRRRARVAHAADQQHRQREHVVLEEVVVRALRAVEQVQRLPALLRLRRRDLLRRREHVRVRDLRAPAEAADAQPVPYRQEDRACCCEEDVAVPRNALAVLRGGASGWCDLPVLFGYDEGRHSVFSFVSG